MGICRPSKNSFIASYISRSQDFVEACVACYRDCFDPSALRAEIERLETEHTALMQKKQSGNDPHASKSDTLA